MKNTILASILIALIMQFFINCGQAQHSQSSPSTVSTLDEANPTPAPTPSAEPDVEEDCVDEEELFAQTYHVFFRQQNCNDCHSPDQIPSIPGFAGPNITEAFQIYERIGPDRIEGKLRGGHQGYVFSDFAATLESYAGTWNSIDCSVGDSGPSQSYTVVTNDISPGFHLTENDPFRCGLNHDVIADKLGWQTLQWDLGDQRDELKGVIIKVDIIIENLEFGTTNDEFYCPTGYRLRNPRVTTTEQDVHIQSLKFRLNGSDQGVATFTGIQTTIPKLSGEFELDPYGASTPYENDHFTSKDTWSVEIDQVFNTRL